MNKIDDKIINKIISDVDIVDVISEDLDLIKKGSNYVGLCPFHDDSNPSFTVSPEKKIFKCFVCNTGGNVINYAMKSKKISYVDAISELGKKINLNINITSNVKLKPVNYLLNDTTKFYKTALATTKEAEKINEYLLKRGFDKEITEKFNLGYSPKENLLSEYYKVKIQKENKYNLLDAMETKLINNEKEFFNSRLMIPIIDENNNTVGFSGRVIDNNTPKYLNSVESNIFEKKRILYNLNNAQKYLNENELFIVEGFFDVMSLAKKDINNVVALMGTAFTNYHLQKILKRKINKIVLCLDNDRAGINTTLNIANILINSGIVDLKVINLKNYNDIDECILNDKEFKIEDYIDDFYLFRINQYLKIYNLENIEEKEKFTTSCLIGLEKLPLTKKNLILQKISTIVKLDINILDNMLFKRENTINVVTNVVNEDKNNIKQNNHIKVNTVKPNNVKDNLFSDDYVILKYAMAKDKYENIDKKIKNNKYTFKDKKIEKIYICFEGYYKLKEKFNIAEFVDFSGFDCFDILNKINNSVEVNEDNIEKIFLKNDKNIGMIYKNGGKYGV